MKSEMDDLCNQEKKVFRTKKTTSRFLGNLGNWER